MGRIDAYAHIMPSTAYERFRELEDRDPPPHVNDDELRDDGIEKRLAMMDDFDIDQQVISLTLPRVSNETPREEFLEITRLANDEIRRIADDYPDRFIPIGTVPFLDGAYLDEARRCVRELGMAGMQIDSNINGTMIDREGHLPFYELMNDVQLPIWIHPTLMDWHPYTETESFLYRMAGWPFDTSMAILRLIYNGILDEYEHLEIVAHHVGGILPYLEERVRNWTAGREEHPERFPPDALPHYSGTLDDYLSRVYGDTANFSRGKTAALNTGLEFFGPENLLFAFDYPYARKDILENTIDAIDSLATTDAIRQKIYSGNVERLLGL